MSFRVNAGLGAGETSMFVCGRTLSLCYEVDARPYSSHFSLETPLLLFGDSSRSLRKDDKRRPVCAEEQSPPM